MIIEIVGTIGISRIFRMMRVFRVIALAGSATYYNISESDRGEWFLFIFALPGLIGLGKLTY